MLKWLLATLLFSNNNEKRNCYDDSVEISEENDFDEDV